MRDGQHDRPMKPKPCFRISATLDGHKPRSIATDLRAPSIRDRSRISACRLDSALPRPAAAAALLRFEAYLLNIAPAQRAALFGDADADEAGAALALPDQMSIFLRRTRDFGLRVPFDSPARFERFVFTERPLLADKCEWLQTSPESPFVLNAVAQRHMPNKLAMMRGRTLKVLTPDGLSAKEIQSADEYVETLARVFGLDLPEAANLWPKIVARHEQLFGRA